MRAILIDPVAKTVSEVEYNGNYRDIYKLLSDPDHGLDVNTFDVIMIDDHNVIFVDDNGLLDDPQHFFAWRDYRQPLAGRGLILGNDDEGETVGTTIPLAKAVSKVYFPELSLEGFDPIPEGTTIEDPAFGKMAVIGHRPVFGPPKPKEPK